MGMRKVFATLFAFLLVVVGINPAQADGQNTIVIIDSGFNLSTISGNVIQEVCIAPLNGCNNGTGFDIGPGSAQTTTSISSRYLSDWNHGTVMAESAIAVNPNIDLIVIRNAKVYSNGNVWFGNEDTLVEALRWVSDNAEEYNIVGVSMSRGSHSYAMNNPTVRKQVLLAQIYSKHLDKMGSDPKFKASIKKFTKRLATVRTTLESMPDIACPASTSLSDLVNGLAQNNIASIFATGNDHNNRYVDSPACLDSSVSVTASDGNGKVLGLANVAPNTDFAVEAPNTSIAAAKLAAKWSLMYNGSYNSTYELIANSGSDSHSWSAVFVP
jgi:hypothetical protein